MEWQKGKGNMKRAKKGFGAVVLGTAIILAGCGDGQTGENPRLLPVMIGGSGAEVQGQDGQGQGQNGQGRSQDGQELNGQKQGGQGQTILTLGTCDICWELTRAVDAYNAINGKYYVEIVDYTKENQDYETACERFKMDLAASKGTDLIWMQDMVADDLGYAGVLADLNTYLKPEDREEYLTNILQYAQTGDSLYEVAATFGLGFLAGKSGVVGTETGWTVDEMLDVFRAHNKDANGLGGVGVNTEQELVCHAIENFVDWDAGRADFCNQEFYDILEFGKSEKGWVKVTPDTVASGTHLAVRAGLSSITDMQYLDWLLGDGWEVKGWPCSQGTGVKVSFYNSLAISSYSKCPEGAWDFIVYYLTLDWLEDYAALHPDIPLKTYASIHGLPLNKAAFEEMLKWSVVQQYYDGTGEPIPFYFGEEGVPDFYANSAEDVERIRKVVALADGRGLSILSAVSRIIGEEISGYKTGGLTAERTAEKMQNRVQLYLDENGLR